jgi:hypothetical protein
MPPLKKLVFGRSFTDHMLEIDWNVQKGWRKPRIVPYGNLSISPASTGLHYGIQVRLIVARVSSSFLHLLLIILLLLLTLSNNPLLLTSSRNSFVSYLCILALPSCCVV